MRTSFLRLLKGGIIIPNGKYEVYITYDYKRRFLGYFENIEDAIEARKNAEQRYFGEYSYDKSMQISNSFRKE